MREGSLDAPIRHPIDWNNPEFYDETALDAELRRVFDICHGCRRCFNLCDSFPRLFDLIDEAPSGELDTVESKDFKPVVDACTLCDMCFLTKCPYVPPHEFNLDFPHLMLRYRAVEARKGEVGFIDKQLTETDRNGKLGTGLSGLANWATKRDNGLTRPVMKATAGIHPDADLPKFADKPLTKAVEAREANGGAPVVNKDAPAYGRKAVIYATCFSNWNRPEIGMAALEVLARNGVETKVLHPECCGMPQLEHGDLGRVAGKARSVAATLGPYVEDGWDIVAMVPSCALMLKFEWPLIVPDDPSVERLAKASFDVSEYIVGIAKKEGMAEGLEPLDGDISVHISCHSRAQNMGQKATELLRLIPKTKVKPIERCSGHGGSWGVKQENFPVAMKMVKPVAKQAIKAAPTYLVSECPLAREHVLQGIEAEGGSVADLKEGVHPIELLAKAYGLVEINK